MLGVKGSTFKYCQQPQQGNDETPCQVYRTHDSCGKTNGEVKKRFVEDLLDL